MFKKTPYYNFMIDKTQS